MKTLFQSAMALVFLAIAAVAYAQTPTPNTSLGKTELRWLQFKEGLLDSVAIELDAEQSKPSTQKPSVPRPAAPTFKTNRVTAQASSTVVDAQTFSFGPSPSHDLMFGDQAVVSGYKLEMVVVATNTLAGTFDLSKPTPAGGLLTVENLRTLFTTLPAGIYVGRVFAYGPGGESNRLQSENQFGKFSAPEAPTGTASFK